jgi:hypothetical protein
MLTSRNASRQARSAFHITRAMGQGAVHAAGSAASGPRCRTSVHTNVRPSPSTASTTSSTVISEGALVSR